MVTMSSDVVAVVVNSPESSSDIAQRLALLLPDRETARKQADQGSTALASLQKQMPNAGILAAMCDENLQRIENLYTSMVLAAVRKDRTGSVRASMRHNGFLGLFDHDRDLLQRLCRAVQLCGPPAHQKLRGALGPRSRAGSGQNFGGFTSVHRPHRHETIRGDRRYDLHLRMSLADSRISW